MYDGLSGREPLLVLEMWELQVKHLIFLTLYLTLLTLHLGWLLNLFSADKPSPLTAWVEVTHLQTPIVSYGDLHIFVKNNETEY